MDKMHRSRAECRLKALSNTGSTSSFPEINFLEGSWRIFSVLKCTLPDFDVSNE
jgi:hypothetical protein